MPDDHLPPAPQRHVGKGAYRDRRDPAYAEYFEEIDEQLGHLLAVVLRLRNISQAELGDLMGLSHAAIRHRLYGRTNWNASEIGAICARLDVDPSLLLSPGMTPHELMERLTAPEEDPPQRPAGPPSTPRSRRGRT